MSGRHVARQRTGGVWSAVGTGVGSALLVALLALACAAVLLPRLAGAVPLTVLTSSMEPTYPPGTLLVVRAVDQQSIRIGDVITYQPVSDQPEVITHRVVGITQSTSGDTSFRTQGDNNPAPDPAPVTAPQVQGTVWYAIPFIGYAATALNAGAKSVIVVVLAVGLFGYATFMIVSWARERRRRRLT